MNIALGLLAVFVLTAATGYFVAQEFAFVTADRLALTQQAELGDRRAARATQVMERLSFMLSGAQLGITVTALVVGFIAKPALAELVAPLLHSMRVPEGAVNGVALAVGFLIATVIQMVLGELVPKNLALAKAESLARSLAASTLLYMAVAGPVIKMFDAAANRVLRTAGIEPVEELHHGATLEELGLIIGESEPHLQAGHVDLLERALVFSDRAADEAMVPRVDVVTVPASTMVSTLDTVLSEHRHTHYPVVGDRVDDVIGIVGLRELMPVTPERATRTQVGDIARPALMVPSSLALPAVVAQMQARGEEVACVMDEYGGFAGLLTWEDIAEELVGEIADETDVDEPLAVHKDGWWTTDAGLRVDEVAQLTGIPLPEGDYDTVAGLLLERLGRLAEPGDLVPVELPPTGLDRPARRADIRVLTIDRHVPEKIGIRMVEVPGLDDEDSGDGTGGSGRDSR